MKEKYKRVIDPNLDEQVTWNWIAYMYSNFHTIIRNEIEKDKQLLDEIQLKRIIFAFQNEHPDLVRYRQFDSTPWDYFIDDENYR